MPENVNKKLAIFLGLKTPFLIKPEQFNFIKFFTFETKKLGNQMITFKILNVFISPKCIFEWMDVAVTIKLPKQTKQGHFINSTHNKKQKI